MNQALNRLSRKINSLFSRKTGNRPPDRIDSMDQQALTRFIVRIQKQLSPVCIFRETALCLDHIFGCRFVGFAFKAADLLTLFPAKTLGAGSFQARALSDFKRTSADGLAVRVSPLAVSGKAVRADQCDAVFHAEDGSASFLYIEKDNGTRLSDPAAEMLDLVHQACHTALSRQIQMQALWDAAAIDPLTGCYNRREFENQLKRTVAGAVRHKNPLSVFMFDLDHFKQVNDTYGHVAGDAVLKTIADLVKKNMRSNDILARYGGEEFIAILPETDRLKAMELADRLREKIAAKPVAHGEDMIRVSASFGVSQLDRRAGMDRIVQDADAMLYRAKLNGRNTVMPGLMKLVPGAVAPRKKEASL